MRTIILCILISVLSHWAWGQEIVVFDTSDTIEAYSLESIVVRTIIQEYKTYSDECWADSTRHDNFLPKPHGYALPLWKDWATGVVDSNYVMYSHGGGGVTLELICEKLPRFHYTHREPTLPGFMEFLERKVKP